jgi:uncharacterized protein
MAAREFDPLRLDVEAFAGDEARLEGRWPLRDMARIAEQLASDTRSQTDEDVVWSVRGERRSKRGGPAQLWLHLRAAARLTLQCQRCLEPMSVPLNIERSILFVPGEAAAEQLDAECEDDVLALTPALDLRELVEDELLLAQPLVPRHEVCPNALPLKDEADLTQERPNPFAVLAELKRGPPLN